MRVNEKENKRRGVVKSPCPTGGVKEKHRAAVREKTLKAPSADEMNEIALRAPVKLLMDRMQSMGGDWDISRLDLGNGENLDDFLDAIVLKVLGGYHEFDFYHVAMEPMHIVGPPLDMTAVIERVLLRVPGVRIVKGFVTGEWFEQVTVYTNICSPADGAKLGICPQRFGFGKQARCLSVSYMRVPLGDKVEHHMCTRFTDPMVVITEEEAYASMRQAAGKAGTSFFGCTDWERKNARGGQLVAIAFLKVIKRVKPEATVWMGVEPMKRSGMCTIHIFTDLCRDWLTEGPENLEGEFKIADHNGKYVGWTYSQCGGYVTAKIEKMVSFVELLFLSCRM